MTTPQKGKVDFFEPFQHYLQEKKVRPCTQAIAYSTYPSSERTLKRKNLDTEKEAKKKSRSSGSDTLVYLKEKAEKEQELKLNELELRKQELAIRKKEVENNHNNQQQMFSGMMEQLQAQNQQMFLLLANINKQK